MDAASTSTADKIAKLKATLEGQIRVVDGRLSSFEKMGKSKLLPVTMNV